MQVTPKASWIQRVETDAGVAGEAVPAPTELPEVISVTSLDFTDPDGFS
jgi:hypothetical protein